MATETLDKAGRIAFMGVTPEVSAALAGVWGIVRPNMETLLNGFYQHVTAVPTLAALIGARQATLKQAQSRHWEMVFSGRFDDAYFDSACEIGMVHYRIGLAPRWYIGDYNYMLRNVTALIARRHRFSIAKTICAINATTTAVMLDMDVAISVFQSPCCSNGNSAVSG